jgi:hypothetical protein
VPGLLPAGRIGHAWALSGPGRFGARTIGMLMTFPALILSAAPVSNFLTQHNFPPCEGARDFIDQPHPRMRA